jgi:hypothetical protein
VKYSCDNSVVFVFHMNLVILETVLCGSSHHGMGRPPVADGGDGL